MKHGGGRINARGILTPAGTGALTIIEEVMDKPVDCTLFKIYTSIQLLNNTIFSAGCVLSLQDLVISIQDNKGTPAGHKSLMPLKCNL